MQNVLNIWRMGSIALEEKMKTVKTFALSKIVYLTFITSISKQFIKKNIQKSLI